MFSGKKENPIFLQQNLLSRKLKRFYLYFLLQKLKKKLKMETQPTVASYTNKPVPSSTLVRTKSICCVSPAAGSCRGSFPTVQAISSLGERPRHPSRNMPRSKAMKPYFTSPQPFFFSASSHPPYILPLLQVGHLKTISLPGI